MENLKRLGEKRQKQKLTDKNIMETEVTSNKRTNLAIVSDREIVMSRVFDAPRALIFKIYTDRKHIPQFWGPSKYTTIVDRLEVRVGGIWRFIQRDARGKEFAFNGVFKEINSPKRLVYTFKFEGMPGHVILETLTFEETNGKTTLTATALFQNIEDRDGMLNSGMESGAAESWDRLAELLEALKRK
jgi:uncharacterized protein YndB with AHSA1/START domain